MTAPRIALVDNGSLRPAATRSLRAIAAALAARTARAVEPVSLLHSSTIPAGELDGRAAEILEPWLKWHAAAGAREFLLVPLFFGPSRALTAYVPERVAHLRTIWPDLRVRLAPPLMPAEDANDERLAAMLEERVREVLSGAGGAEKPAVAVVDHGSPERRVTAVRDRVAAQLRARLGADVRAVAPCSMERRDGPEYAFGDPLLTALLDQPEFARGRVIVAMLFLSPGRHAGPEGDVAEICRAAEARHAGLQTTMTELLGSHPLLVEILAERLAQGLGGEPLR